MQIDVSEELLESYFAFKKEVEKAISRRSNDEKSKFKKVVEKAISKRQKKYQCQYCNKGRFTTKFGLKRHGKTFHSSIQRKSNDEKNPKNKI